MSAKDLLGIKIQVLNDGFVMLVDTMGDDSSIVQAARVSYGAGTKKVHEDRGLIRYLMRHQHSSPFEMCEIKLLVRVPMDCWRQWIRHRTASVNEYSTRYSDAIDSTQTTLPDHWRLQSPDNKQGSRGHLAVEEGQILSQKEVDLQLFAREVYQERLDAGVAREQARKDLPLSTYTEAYWKIDLHNLFHFLRLRLDSHAQYEIRTYARAIASIVEEWVPIAWAAFCDYQLNSMKLSSIDIEVIHAFNHSGVYGAEDVLIKHGLLKSRETKVNTTRELAELVVKLKTLGHTIPAHWVS